MQIFLKAFKHHFGITLIPPSPNTGSTIIAAVFLDSDFETVQTVVENLWKEEIKNIDIILIGEMSTDGHLMNETYQKQVIDIAENVENEIGRAHV